MDFREVTEFIKDFFGYIVLFLVIVFLFTFVVAFHPIAGNSMVPNLDEGSIVLVSKFHPHLIKVKREQIVIVKTEHKSYIKRVIGLPGEKVEVKDNKLYINEKEYKEEYIPSDIVTDDFSFEDICDAKECPNGKIPKDKYLVLGDNREDSTDSRNFGLISKDEIKGVAIFKIWPINDVKKF